MQKFLSFVHDLSRNDPAYGVVANPRQRQNESNPLELAPDIKKYKKKPTKTSRMFPQ